MRLKCTKIVLANLAGHNYAEINQVEIVLVIMFMIAILSLSSFMEYYQPLYVIYNFDIEGTILNIYVSKIYFIDYINNWIKIILPLFIGVKSVEVSRKQNRVTVTGTVEPNKVLDKVKSTGKRAEFWPYVEYNLVSYPYASQAYDKKAPTGYVRNVVQAFPSPKSPTEGYTSLFSDENPNACSVMWGLRINIIRNKKWSSWWQARSWSLAKVRLKKLVAVDTLPVGENRRKSLKKGHAFSPQ